MTLTAPETTPAEVEDQLASARRLLSPRQMKSISLAATHTIALWVGAVSAGKTIASLFAFLIAIAQVRPGGLIVIVGQTIQSIERNVLTPLQDERLFGPLARLTVHTRNSGTATILGRTVEIIGASDVRAESRIRGGTYALVYVDEAVLLPMTKRGEPEFFDMLVTRLREPGARMIATTNPAGRRHWLKRLYIDRAAVHDLVVFHFTMRDNPSLEFAYVRRMFRAYTGAFFLRMILGLWTTAEGAVYDAFDPDRHVVKWEDMPPIADLIAVGIDHGTTNPTSVVLLGITDERTPRGMPAPRLILVDEWRYDSTTKDPETGLTPPRLTNVEQSKLIKAWLGSLDHIPHSNPGWGARVRSGLVFVDPAAADFREQLGRDRVVNAPASNEVAPGIAEVASLLALDRLLISDRCQGVLDELPEYTWDAKKSEKGEDVPVKAGDHSLDAMRYVVRSSRQIWGAQFRRAYGRAA